MWSDEQLTVLMALFVSQPFYAGDDSTETNALISQEIGRDPGAVDRQWRNMRDYLLRLDLPEHGGKDLKVGENVKAVVDRYRSDFAALRRDALRIMEEENWNLKGLMASEG